MPKVTWNGMRISDPQTDLSPPLLHQWRAPVLTMLALHASPMKPVAVGASSALNRAMQKSENSLPAPSCGWFWVAGFPRLCVALFARSSPGKCSFFFLNLSGWLLWKMYLAQDHQPIHS
ncbi:hypothetical protein PVAP13_1NG070801 [Panicum virgatum]|uniref:Uncharacterized protein n=1 Tax=Panicum virgatum TaxID=38727 RepID=A0A8T0WP38_PANVG|nr:hypothetical protein PVAP13_1NG070801 [Panicum virgatum]